MNCHLLVLVHGLWGNPSHLNYIEEQFLENAALLCASDEKLVVYRTGSHQGYLTYDGIDINGRRVSNEIETEIEKLNASHEFKVTKFSILGYSLGGLISRYAIGILFFKQYFDNIEPVNFVSICSPHVGVLTPGSGTSIRLFNIVAPHLLAHTGSQLFLKDKTPSGKRLPLLSLMCQDQSVFYEALKLFKYRTLYSNITNDKRTSWFTAGISAVDPFNSMYNNENDNYELEYIKNYEPIIIDINQPVKFTRITQKQTVSGNLVQRKVKWLILFVRLILFTPIWLVWFISVSTFQRLKLQGRIREFLKDNNFPDLYEFGSESVQEFEENLVQADDLLESVWDAMTSKDPQDQYYDVSSISEEKEMGRSTGYNAGDSFSDLAITTTIEEMSNKESDTELYKDFELAVSPEQAGIIEQLNLLTWKKFPILIRNTKASHAASIVRQNIGVYNEGKVVVKHLLDTFKNE